MIDAKTLRLVTQNGLQNFAAGHILDGIAALRTLLPHCAAETILCSEAESLEENYHHMLSFLRGGGSDEKRSEVQEKIQRRGIALLEQASRAIRIALNKGRYCEAVKTVSLNEDILETDERQDDIFDMLWTSPLWTSQDTALWYDFILRQRDMVQQNLMGALFLALWEHYDAEKMQLLGILADSECHRTRITAITYLLLLRLRHKELLSLMPPLPDKLLSRKGRQFIAQVEYEFLLMLVSEKDMDMELKEAESLTNELLSGKQSLNVNNIKGIIELRGRYLRNRLKRGLDINLSKAPFLHNCEYMRRIAHWFQPFDKTHPLFQSIMIDEKGNEKQHLSMLVDVIMDCDVDKLATIYLAAHDNDFSKALQQLDDDALPDIENAVAPEYTFRLIMQDLYRFFVHSPLHSELFNPFRGQETLLDFPELAALITAEDSIKCCELLFELRRYKQALPILDDIISCDGASVPALLLKAKALSRQGKNAEATSCLRSAEMLEPENTDVLRLLAECYSIRGRHAEELEYLQKLEELLPENREIRFRIPGTLQKLGRNEEALQLYFKLDYQTAEDDPDYRTILASIADTSLFLGKLDIAERYTEKELEAYDGKKTGAQIRAGHIKLIQGDWKGSIDHYIRAINLFREKTDNEAQIIIERIKADLVSLDKQWSSGLPPEHQRSARIFNGQWSMNKDLLLICDILQAATDNTTKPDSPQSGGQ